MKIVKIAQQDKDMIFVDIEIDEKGNIIVDLPDGQNLGKSCDKIVDHILPRTGVKDHTGKADYHADPKPTTPRGTQSPVARPAFR
jgi:hypothetical protein